MSVLRVLRVYDPPECDVQGVPLGWERCRECDGSGQDPHPRAGPGVVCPRCVGYGSLKAAALAGLKAHVWKRGGQHPDDPATRCEDCGHPMSDGTWEPGITRWTGLSDLTPGTMEWASAHLRHGDEPPLTLSGDPPLTFPVHYSACDEGCRHGGPGRYGIPDSPEWDPLPEQFVAQGVGAVIRELEAAVEASWRAVDVRTLGWPHDLRPERMAVLCLRCWAGR